MLRNGGLSYPRVIASPIHRYDHLYTPWWWDIRSCNRYSQIPKLPNSAVLRCEYPYLPKILTTYNILYNTLYFGVTEQHKPRP